MACRHWWPGLPSAQPLAVPSQRSGHRSHWLIIKHKAELIQHHLLKHLAPHASNNTPMGWDHFLIQLVVPGYSLELAIWDWHEIRCHPIQSTVTQCRCSIQMSLTHSQSLLSSSDDIFTRFFRSQCEHWWVANDPNLYFKTKSAAWTTGINSNICSCYNLIFKEVN